MPIIAKNNNLVDPLSIYIKSGKRVELVAGGQKDLLNECTVDEVRASDDVAYHIIQSNITINDGTQDLTQLQAIDLIRQRTNIDFPQTSVEDSLKVSIYPPEGMGGTFVTHDWTDKTTWWNDSVRVEDQVLANGGDNKRYGGPQGVWIDLFHGKVSYENKYQSGKEVIIKRDGVVVSEDEYVVSYEDGYITFDDTQDLSSVITASYNYENGSTCAFKPDSGKVNRVVYTELQFTEDVDFTSPIAFQLWVYNPYDLPNKVPYGLPVVYKSMKDIINSSNMPTCSYLPTLKGFTRNMIILPFNYFTTLDLKSALGMELRVYLDQSSETTPVEGEFATLSIYYSEVDE